MPAINIGIVTDEVSRNLEEAIELCQEWGIAHYELREGSTGRVPAFTPDELKRLDRLVENGGTITAVSPGIFKGHIEDKARWTREAQDTFPRAIDLAQRLGCTTLIAFGFEESDGRSENRLQVLKAFESIAEQVASAGMRIALENEPGFWIDRPDTTVALLDEIRHPLLRLNWDPANLHWSGQEPDDEAVDQLKDYIINLHVKDFAPGDDENPWKPLGEGIVPWKDLLPEILNNVPLSQVTLETHCEPLVENSRKSLDYLLNIIG